MTIKERLHHLLDDLPPAELPVAARFLEYLRDAGSDPFLRAMAAAPIDDEPFTKADARASREAERAIARGDVVPHAAVGRRTKR